MAVAKVIKYDGGPDVFAWKFPCEELGTWSQVIVNEAQEAVLYKGGQALDVFAAGRHQLSTANIPLLSRLVNLPFGGNSPFAAEVWYINKLFSLDIKWGTPMPIQLQDPKYKVFVPVRSFGQFGIQIVDSKTFLTKLVGTVPQFDKATLTKFFKGLYLTYVQDTIASYLVDKQVSILEINAKLRELSSYLVEAIAPTLAEYGIRLVNFYVNNVNVPEDDPAVVQLKGALAKKAEMEVIGYNYTQQRSFDALEGAATNPGSGQAGIMGAAMGVGMGFPIGGAMGNQMAGIIPNFNTQSSKQCVKCSADMSMMATFCPTCGADARNPATMGYTDEDTTKCSACGERYAKTYRFCPKCGDAHIPCAKCGEDLNLGEAKCPKCGTGVPHPCPKCSSMLPPGAKFCGECGESFGNKCPECGAAITGNPKFCFECGKKLGGEV